MTGLPPTGSRKTGQTDPGRADQGQADRGQADQGQADQGQADQGQADQGQADQGQADQGQADQGQAGPGREDLPLAAPQLAAGLLRPRRACALVVSRPQSLKAAVAPHPRLKPPSERSGAGHDGMVGRSAARSRPAQPHP
jgi:hypothetical protein